MTVAAIYARFSSDAQREESIDIQVGECSRLIEREGWTRGEVYSDHAMTGRNDRRPSFQRMVSDGEAGLFDVLVVYKNDRFARSIEVSRRYKSRLRAAGVRIVSVREGESKDTPDGFLHEAMDEAFAEYYSRNLAVLVRQGIDASARKGLPCGRRVYGYRVEGDGFAEDPATAPVVRRVFAEYLRGYTVREIADGLTADGVPTPRGGSRWHQTSVGWMLRAADYRGVYHYAGVEIEGGMPRLVSDGDFAEVQRRLGSKCRRRPNREQPTADYVLTGKCFCLSCGQPVAGTSGTGRGGKYLYYRCHAKCGERGFRKERLEALAASAVRDALSDPFEVEAMVAAVMREQGGCGGTLEALEVQMAVAESRVARLVDSVADGMPYDLVRERVESLREEMAGLAPRIEEERRRAAVMLDESKVRAALGYFVEMIPEVESFAGLAVRDYVNSVWVGGDDVVVVFSTEREDVPPLDAVRSLLNEKTPAPEGESGVRLSTGWWTLLSSSRTYNHGKLFARVVSIA